jgi:hypothetical protein
MSLPVIRDREASPVTRRDIWERLAGFEAAVAEVEDAVLSCDSRRIDRFRSLFPAAIQTIAIHQADLRKYASPSLRVAGWRCRLTVAEALMTLGEGCRPSHTSDDRRGAFDRCRHLLANAERQRAALPHDSLYGRALYLLRATARLQFTKVVRGSRLRDVPHLERLSPAAYAYRKMARYFFGARAD